MAVGICSTEKGGGEMSGFKDKRMGTRECKGIEVLGRGMLAEESMPVPHCREAEQVGAGSPHPAAGFGDGFATGAETLFYIFR